MNRCGNCGNEWTDEQLDQHNLLGVENIEGLPERIDAGCEVPSGECPDCHALTYVVVPEELLEQFVKLRAQSALDDAQNGTNYLQEFESLSRQLAEAMTVNQLHAYVKDHGERS